MAKVLVITSKKEGFRRLNIAHSANPTEYPIDKFSDKDLETLKSEPMLVVYEKEVPDPEPELEMDDKKGEPDTDSKKGKGK